MLVVFFSPTSRKGTGIFRWVFLMDVTKIISRKGTETFRQYALETYRKETKNRPGCCKIPMLWAHVTICWGCIGYLNRRLKSLVSTPGPSPLPLRILFNGVGEPGWKLDLNRKSFPKSRYARYPMCSLHARLAVFVDYNLYTRAMGRLMLYGGISM